MGLQNRGEQFRKQKNIPISTVSLWIFKNAHEFIESELGNVFIQIDSFRQNVSFRLVHRKKKNLSAFE